MTKLIDVRKVEKFSLPSFPDVVIEVYDGFLTHEFEKLNIIESDYDKGIGTLLCLIKSWSFTDDNDKPLEINKENLGKLPAKDYAFLIEKIGKIMENVTEKKEVSSKK